MLDSEVFSGDDSPLNGAGSSSVGTGGGSHSSGTSSGGKAGINEPDPAKSAETCKNYCAGFAPLCPSRLDGQDCFQACQWEVNSFGKKCQGLGIKTLQCLTPFFSGFSSGGCEPAVGRALQECGDEVNAFEKCKPPSGKPQPPNPTPTPSPMPRPDPMPNPTPTPTPTPTSCPGMGEGGPGYCKMTFSCPDGPYTVSCNEVPGGGNECWCYSPYGEPWQTRTPLVGPDVCFQEFSPCGF